MGEVTLYFMPGPIVQSLEERRRLRCSLSKDLVSVAGRNGERHRADLIEASTYDKHSVDPSIRPVCTRCYFTMTYMIQVCSDFH